MCTAHVKVKGQFYRNQFSTSSMWVHGIELRPPTWGEGRSVPLSTEPCYGCETEHFETLGRNVLQWGTAVTGSLLEVPPIHPFAFLQHQSKCYSYKHTLFVLL